MTWLPPLALHRIVLVALHAGVPPLIPALPFVADGTPEQGSDVVSVATQTILGYGVLGVLALALAFIVWKGSFVPQKRVDELLAASRADLLRENERLLAEKEKAEAQLSEALRFARDDLAPLLYQFNASTSSLLPILQRVVQNADDNPPPRRRNRELP